MEISKQAVKALIEMHRERLPKLIDQVQQSINIVTAVRFCNNCGQDTIVDKEGCCVSCESDYSPTLFGLPIPPMQRNFILETGKLDRKILDGIIRDMENKG